MTAPIFRLTALACVCTLTACSLFSTSPSASLVTQIHREVPTGLGIDEAELRMSALGFGCSERHGAYTDEGGHNHENVTFRQCTRRPGTVSFACANRDQVIIVPGPTGKVTDVEVLRGPDCTAK